MEWYVLSQAGDSHESKLHLAKNGDAGKDASAPFRSTDAGPLDNYSLCQHCFPPPADVDSGDTPVEPDSKPKKGKGGAEAEPEAEKEIVTADAGPA